MGYEVMTSDDAGQFVCNYVYYHCWSAKRRRMMTPAFHLKKLKAMIPAFYTRSIELDVWPEFQKLAGDVISQTAFGSNYKEGSRIFQLQKEQVLLVLEAARSPYVPSFRFIPTIHPFLDKLKFNDSNLELKTE
ncbi:hypothetical protein ACLOJK_038501 [Asimina triloba]